MTTTNMKTFTDRSAFSYDEIRARRAHDGSLSDNITIALLENIKSFYLGRVRV